MAWMHLRGSRQYKRRGGEDGVRTFEALATLNPRCTMAGRRSMQYSMGTLAARNSYMTSVIVRLGRCV